MKEFNSVTRHGAHLHVQVKPMNKMINLELCLVVRQNRLHWTEQSLLPQLLQLGTETHRTPERLQQAFERLGAVEVEVRSEAWNGRLLIAIRVLLANPRYLPHAEHSLPGVFSLLGEMVRRPLLLDRQAVTAQWETIKRKQAERQSEAEQDEAEQVMERLRELTCADHPAAWPKFGFVQELQDLRVDEVIDCCEEMLREAEVHVYAVGAFEEAEVLAAAGLAFVRERKEAAAFIRPPLPAAKAVPLRCCEVRDMDRFHVAVALHAGDVAQRDPAVFMFANLFSLLPDSRLYEVARNREHWVYSIDTHLREDSGHLFLRTTLERENGEPFVQAVQQVLTDLQQQPLSQEELADLRTACIRKLKGRSDLPWRAIESETRALLAGSPFTWPRMVEAFSKVTAADVQELARQVRLDTVLFMGGGAG